jgi:predicted acylesterase/phospholipase RssA
MKKVLYLHGLESKQGGKKVDFLANEFCVHSPTMDYKNPMVQNELEFIMRQFDPDIIIGSSMGGYAADILAQKYGKPAILFNPALHNRSFEPAIEPLVAGEEADLQDRKIVILGKNDEVIPPYITKIMLENNRNYEVIIEEMGHRTPLNIFIDTINNYKNEL